MTKAFKLSISCDSNDNCVSWIECNTFIIEDDNKNILDISEKEYIPTKGDKFYFLPGVSIPRVKLKDLTKDYGIKSTRLLKDATHIFAGRSTTNKVCERLWSYRIPTSAIEMLYNHLKEQELDKYYLEKLETALLYNEHGATKPGDDPESGSKVQILSSCTQVTRPSASDNKPSGSEDMSNWIWIAPLILLGVFFVITLFGLLYRWVGVAWVGQAGTAVVGNPGTSILVTMLVAIVICIIILFIRQG